MFSKPKRIVLGALLVVGLVPLRPDAAEPRAASRASGPSRDGSETRAEPAGRQADRAQRPEPALSASFDGMRIVSYSKRHVASSAGRFDLDRSSITASRAGGEEEAVIRFPAGFLENLSVDRQAETVYFSNRRVQLSISADSVLRIVFDRAVDRGQFAVRLGRYRASHFEAGAFLGVADRRRGIYFSPIWSRAAVQKMPRVFNRTTHAFQYDDRALAAAGLKAWKRNDRECSYRIGAGDGFVFGLAYPKAVNRSTYRNVVPNTIGGDLISQQDRYDYSANLDSFLASRRGNVAILNWNTYGNASFRAPYKAANPDACREFVEQAREKNVGVVVYISPYHFYEDNTADVDAILKTVEYFRGIDENLGVYYDGAIRDDFGATRELLIRTRNLLGKDGVLVFHNSENPFGTVIDPLNPANNSLATVVWQFEGVGILDRDQLRLNLASGTVTDVLPELRVDSRGKALSQAAQFRLVTESGGRMRINPFLDRTDRSRIPFQLDTYLRLLNETTAAWE